MNIKTNKKMASVIALALSAALVLPAAAFGATIDSTSEAASLAKKKVGVSTAKVVDIERDYEKGWLMYEVELKTKTKEYSLLYRAHDSKLIEYEWELRSTKGQKRTGKNLSTTTIKKKAKKKVSSAKITSVYKYRDDGLTIYKVKMKKSSKTYTLYYNAKSGSLVEYKWKIAMKSATTADSADLIGEAKAKEIALEKVPDGTIWKVELETDDGVKVYEVDMVKDGYEYDLEIDAKTGAIVKYEVELID